VLNDYITTHLTIIIDCTNSSETFYKVDRSQVHLFCYMVVQILSAIESFTTHLTIIARLQRLFWNILGIHRSHDHIEVSGIFFMVVPIFSTLECLLQMSQLLPDCTDCPGTFHRSTGYMTT